MRAVLVSAALLLTMNAQADEVTCKGSITSIQGEGLVARSHRFEVDQVTGKDLAAVLDQCKRIARERQNRAARRNPGGDFRKSSTVELECVQGREKFEVRRVLDTSQLPGHR